MAKYKSLNEDKYKTGTFPYPAMEEVSEEEKNKKPYNLKMCEAVWHLYRTDRTSVGYSMYDYYNLFRLYAFGRQPSFIYKAYLSEQVNTSDRELSAESISRNMTTNQESQYKGWMNVDFENIFSFMPKVMRMFNGYMSDVDFDMKASNVDVDSGVEEENNMLEYWSKSFFLNDINEIRENAELPLETLDYQPDNLHELEIIKEEGGFKQPYAMDLEKCLTHTQNISNWKESLKEKLQTDLITCGCAFVYRYFNTETCKEQWGYVDPCDYIGQYSKHSDFSDSDSRGFKKRVTISELRRQGVSEKELEVISEKVYGLYGNPTEAEWKNQTQRTGTTYDNKKTDFCVDVLYLWWTDVVHEKKIKYVTKSGEVRLFNYDKKIEERRKNSKQRYIRNNGSEKGYRDRPDEKYVYSKEKVKDVRMRVMRHAKWIIGTDILLEYGLMENQVRPRYNEPENPIVGFKIPGRSMMDLLTKPADLYNIAVLRFENTLSRAVEEGYAVDTSVMIASEQGGDYAAMKALELHRQTGYFLYEGMIDGLQRGGTPVPITKLPGTLGEGLMNALSVMESCLKFVEDITGFSPVTLGATPAPESQVGTQQMMAQSTMTAMKVYEDALKSIKQQLSNSSAEALQLLLKTDGKARKEYAKIIGKDGVDRIRKARKLHVQYGIDMVPKPKNTQIQEAIVSINRAYEMKLKSPETPGLNESQRTQLVLELHNGANIYQVLYKMDYWIRKDEQEIERKKEKFVKMQGEENQRLKQEEGKQAMQLEQLKLKNEVVKSNLKVEENKAVENQKTRGNIIETLIKEDAAFRNKMKEILLQNGLDINNQQQQNQIPNP